MYINRSNSPGLNEIVLMKCLAYRGFYFVSADFPHSIPLGIIKENIREGE